MDDLSNLTTMNYGSMAGGNMVSTPPPFAAPGSPSESTGHYPEGTPALDPGETWHPGNRADGGDTFAGYGWADPDDLPDTGGWARV